MTDLPKTYTAPGLVDLQVNGYAGFNFNGDPARWSIEDLHDIRAKLNRRGVTAILPTIITDDLDAMLGRIRRYVELIEADSVLAECFAGLHVEGPFISAETGPRGTHPAEHCKDPADLPDFLEKVQQASGGRVKIVTLAPERKGAIDFIGRLGDAGICAAVGHTNATPEDIIAAADAGATMATHLGNGSHAMLPRMNNYVQAQLSEDRMEASFIADGHHVPFTTLKNYIRAKQLSRSILVTDAMSAAEMPPGEYEFSQHPVVVREDGFCQVPGQQCLAGSALTLDKAIINTAMHCDVSFEDAWTMASTRPAELVGLDAQPEVTVRITDDGFVCE